jgi:hypothetical protein
VLGATAIVALIRKLLRALESASAADESRHASA